MSGASTHQKMTHDDSLPFILPADAENKRFHDIVFAERAAIYLSNHASEERDPVFQNAIDAVTDHVGHPSTCTTHFRVVFPPTVADAFHSCIKLEFLPHCYSYVPVRIYHPPTRFAFLGEPKRVRVATLRECLVYALLDASEDFDNYRRGYEVGVRVTSMTADEWAVMIRTAISSHTGDCVLNWPDE